MTIPVRYALRALPAVLLVSLPLGIAGQSAPQRGQQPAPATWADEVLKQESYAQPPKEIADAVLGAKDAAGYGIHTLMNRFCGRYRIPVKVVFMAGCDHRQKFQKWGPWDAAVGMFHLISQVARTWLKTVLVPSRIPQLNFEPPEFGRRAMTPSRTPGEVEG